MPRVLLITLVTTAPGINYGTDISTLERAPGIEETWLLGGQVLLPTAMWPQTNNLISEPQFSHLPKEGVGLMPFNF